MESTTKNVVWWRRWRKRLTRIFRKKSSPTVVETPGDTSAVVPDELDTGVVARGEDEASSCRTETSPTVYYSVGLEDECRTGAFRQEMAELKAERLKFLCAESASRNKRTVARTCDTEQENCRLTATVCELQDRLAESEARRQELEGWHRTSHAAHREQTAKIDDLTDENGTLRDALSDSTRRTKSAVRSIRRAESIVHAAGQRTDAAVHEAERLAALAAERRTVLSSAVADLQSVLSSSVAELRVDVLQTAMRKMQYALAATDGDSGTDDEI